MSARDLDRKVILVTGANTGIGRVAAVELAARGAHVVLACRNEEKARPVIDEIRARGGDASFLALDLGSLRSVRAAADAFLARDQPLHVLVNNAGVGGHTGVTQDGFEITFGTNHLGHFLLTKLLEKKLVSSAPARVVNVSSKAHYGATGIAWDSLQRSARSLVPLPAYELSKLCNVLHARELARRLAGTGVSAFSLHPGVVATDVWRRVPPPLRALIKLFMISPEKGALTTVHCATAVGIETQSGSYWDKCQLKKPSRTAHDDALASELWQRSEAWVAPFLA
jgi:NAD(P)-dependent dehydrogenase (short-subunit alcohol dehydrogenase family)